MLITSLSPSAYQKHDSCEMSYFIEYVLKWRGKANIQADKGTIVHKILEILAKIKLAQQNKINNIEDDIYGKLNINNFDIGQICEKIYNYYSQTLQQDWSNKDFEDCKNWAWKVLDFNNGLFNPLNLNIISPEQHFELEINESWAFYEYKLENEIVKGQLKLRGIIDLVTEPSPNTYEIIDWKTGKRLNWATGEEKTHEKLQKDIQLMIYFYAIHQLYPQIKQALISIFFINDGGPFTLYYSKEYIPEILANIRKKFEHIKEVQLPQLTKSWRCNRFCFNGKTTFEGTNIEPIYNNGKCISKCEQIALDIKRKGMDRVVKEYIYINDQI